MTTAVIVCARSSTHDVNLSIVSSAWLLLRMTGVKGVEVEVRDLERQEADRQRGAVGEIERRGREIE